ncbi:SPOR domain-containing protein [Gallaecimonas sp. GXIMD4217]|uniref:SPOR domain-containing protein n=1 Tax=Gallaecimonas sp. GXIMD4217 TaxID=3131927 RepID=UPI00311B1A61
MSSPVKNRIVGTLVLLALGALIVPELLREPETPTPEQFEVIPLRPELGEVPAAKTFPADSPAAELELPAEVAAVDDGEEPQADDKDTEAQLPPAPAGFDDSAFAVQLGAFKNHQAAAELVERLRQGGYKAFRQQSGGLSRVFVGPELDRGKLELMLPKLNGYSGLKGRIVRYEPLNN